MSFARGVCQGARLVVILASRTGTAKRAANHAILEVGDRPQPHGEQRHTAAKSSRIFQTAPLSLCPAMRTNQS